MDISINSLLRVKASRYNWDGICQEKGPLVCVQCGLVAICYEFVLFYVVNCVEIW